MTRGRKNGKKREKLNQLVWTSKYRIRELPSEQKERCGIERRQIGRQKTQHRGLRREQVHRKKKRQRRWRARRSTGKNLNVTRKGGSKGKDRRRDVRKSTSDSVGHGDLMQMKHTEAEDLTGVDQSDRQKGGIGSCHLFINFFPVP